ncbi:cupin domain-containing protein [Anaerobium acetethylicum]|uniref:Cupin domain-containing protein n=1 Tax=Anaerobium acetethylicum TaxID=1619234 RepID=A0A1D3TW36_9FIRM|nr:hypothetical protein [Anaerobium acetethylicum]SCP98415.1 hypothetical protein SAMN05421730_102028 [Anaerobium acetethylicum]
MHATYEQLPMSIADKLENGNGTIEIKEIIPEGHRPENCERFSIVTLNRRCSIGTHKLLGKQVFVSVLSGEVISEHQGSFVVLKEGDMLKTSNGSESRFANIGKLPCVLLVCSFYDEPAK